MNKFKNPKYIEHLERLTYIENEDFQNVMEKYDATTTFYYLDPHINLEKINIVTIIFVTETHERLMNVLKKY